MKTIIDFWKRRFETGKRAELENTFGDVISMQEAQQIRGGDKEYTPLYDTEQESQLRNPSILLDFM
ncbi:hypothetical protein [Spirosoma oryzicola]|uniref:hypothetical protein n=1 Tax=Spirosoma oryzicola TaxID=2898794 RepID=UPI001E4DAEC7|nr:hypothetical protein [Spirosoma oryzicola]UHG94924.1 hypothetical protein LQ777_29890 [Spirosoma oryzicola]